MVTVVYRSSSSFYLLKTRQKCNKICKTVTGHTRLDDHLSNILRPTIISLVVTRVVHAAIGLAADLLVLRRTELLVYTY